MVFAHTIGGTRYTFATLRELMARATPARSGDTLAVERHAAALVEQGRVAVSEEFGAAFGAQLAWILAEAHRLRLTGVGLKPAPPQLAVEPSG